MRRDVAERREKILDAAEEVFTLLGIYTPLEAVTERAGVGSGTFYRNFPDRQALLDALLDRSLIRIETQLKDGEVENSICILIENIAQSLVISPVLSDYWRSTGRTSVVVNQARERFIRIAEKCLQNDSIHGRFRTDLVAEDFPVISGMLGGILCGRNLKEREKIKERVLSILYAGILMRIPSKNHVVD